jgi:hypothetical protein
MMADNHLSWRTLDARKLVGRIGFEPMTNGLKGTLATGQHQHLSSHLSANLGGFNHASIRSLAA